MNVLMFSCLLLIVCILNGVWCSRNDTLELVFAVFRHGDKTNEKPKVYDNYPYANETYFPVGKGFLTNKGKETAYNLGKNLRERYKDFLKNYYFPNDVYAITTDTKRTKMTLELVLANMFPPVGTINEWHYNLNWQPIPFDVMSPDDNIATFPYLNCRNFYSRYQSYYLSVLGTSLRERYAQLSATVGTHAGIIYGTFDNVCLLYTSFQVDKEWGLKLPEWIDKNLENLKNAYVDFYKFSVNFPKLNTVSGGFLVKKITEVFRQKINKQIDQKLHLMSAHDSTILYLMGALGVYYPHIPNYGACFLIELHNIDGFYGVKMFYLDSVGSTPKQ